MCKKSTYCKSWLKLFSQNIKMPSKNDRASPTINMCDSITQQNKNKEIIISPLIFLNQFLLECSCFTMLCQFLLYSKVNQFYVYIYPVFLRFPSRLGHHRALSRVPRAIEQVLMSYLLYTQECIYVNPNLQVHPTLPLAPLIEMTFQLA